MLPDRVSNPGPLTYESGALPIALRGPASGFCRNIYGPEGSPFFAELWSGIGLYQQLHAFFPIGGLH